MRIDQAPEGGKTRATAAAALDGQVGVWGDTDMLCVQYDASGNLVIAGAGDNCIGVIWTKEGRKVLSDGTEDEVIGGKKYTVFSFCELVEAEVGSSPSLSAGDELYAIATGDVANSAGAASADVYIGQVVTSGNGLRISVNVNGRPVHA